MERMDSAHENAKKPNSESTKFSGEQKV